MYMKLKNIILQSLLCALGVVLYVFLLVRFVMSGEKNFSIAPDYIAGLLVLTSFIVSAAITGSLVLAKPIILFIEKKRKEAFIFFFSTLAWLVLFVSSILIYISYLQKVTPVQY